GQHGYGSASFPLAAIGQASATREPPTPSAKTGYRALEAQYATRENSKLTRNLGSARMITPRVIVSQAEFSVLNPSVKSSRPAVRMAASRRHRRSHPPGTSACLRLEPLPLAPAKR